MQVSGRLPAAKPGPGSSYNHQMMVIVSIRAPFITAHHDSLSGSALAPDTFLESMTGDTAMLEHPTANRSFYEKMLASHTLRHGAPDDQQREELRQLASSLVEQLGITIEFSSRTQGRRPADWTPSRHAAEWAAKTPTSRVVRRFSTRPEDDD